MCKCVLETMLDVHVIVDINFRRFPPSLLTAALFAAVRATLNICPMWPDRLRNLTDYTCEDMEMPLAQILA